MRCNIYLALRLWATESVMLDVNVWREIKDPFVHGGYDVVGGGRILPNYYENEMKSYEYAECRRGN